MGQQAVAAALRDACIDYSQVQAVVASYCYGDPTCGMLYGQRPLLQPKFSHFIIREACKCSVEVCESCYDSTCSVLAANTLMTSSPR